MEFAIVRNGVVENVIVAGVAFIIQEHPDALRVDNISPVPGIGWTYANGEFVAPRTNPPPPPVPTLVFSRFAFRLLFTTAELIAIDNFRSNGTLSAEQVATLNTITKNFDAAEDIDLSDPSTHEGVGYLVSCGLLAQSRADTILSGQRP